MLASGGMDGRIRLWDLSRDSSERRTFVSESKMADSPTGSDKLKSKMADSMAATQSNELVQSVSTGGATIHDINWAKTSEIYTILAQSRN